MDKVEQKVKKRAYAKKYYEKHQDKIREKRRERYQQNKPKLQRERDLKKLQELKEKYEPLKEQCQYGPLPVTNSPCF